ncbi:helix-turn-helix domain-containing protein, partial [Nocardioides sp.]|uniref:helix-turn-helix domain-containing protein n=1 Tax=Nocardioides sp. TaxID=35761 RepID=UPI0039C9D468
MDASLGAPRSRDWSRPPERGRGVVLSAGDAAVWSVFLTLVGQATWPSSWSRSRSPSITRPPTRRRTRAGTLVGNGPNRIPGPLVSYGLRTVDGSCNNLVAGQERFGAADELFPRLTAAEFKSADSVPAGCPWAGSPTSYQAASAWSTRPTRPGGTVADSRVFLSTAVNRGRRHRQVGHTWLVRPDLIELTKTIDPGALGARLRSARLRAGLTQSQVAGSDLSTAYVSRIEAGQRRPDP